MAIVVDVTGLDEVRSLMRRLSDRLVFQALKGTVDEVEQYVYDATDAHAKTGNRFVSSVRSSQIGPLSFEVRNDLQIAPHALFVHDGTRPHPIFPRDRKVLRWAVGGRFIFAKQVQHPGYAGDRWMDRAAALAPQAFARHLSETLREETR